MESLKLSALAILIPLGLLLSETVAASPEQDISAEGQLTHPLGKTCYQLDAMPGLNHGQSNSFGLSDETLGLLILPDTTPLHHDRGLEQDVCRRDIDLSETG